MTNNDANRTSGERPGEAPGAEIVVGLDGSPAAAAALLWAAEQSEVHGVPLRVVYAWHMKALEMASATAGFCEAATADARARATRWVLDTLGGDAAAIRWTLDIVEGPPGPVLVIRSRGARLLVLGTRGHSGLRRAVLGSVSHYCLSHADPPVVAVPALSLGEPATGPATASAQSG